MMPDMDIVSCMKKIIFSKDKYNVIIQQKIAKYCNSFICGRIIRIKYVKIDDCMIE